jgi:hypothetical protein
MVEMHPLNEQLPFTDWPIVRSILLSDPWWSPCYPGLLSMVCMAHWEYNLSNLHLSYSNVSTNQRTLRSSRIRRRRQCMWTRSNGHSLLHRYVIPFSRTTISSQAVLAFLGGSDLIGSIYMIYLNKRLQKIDRAMINIKLKNEAPWMPGWMRWCAAKEMTPIR